MIDTFTKIKPILSWLAIIFVGLISGREITQYFYDNSQTRRIAELQKELVLTLIDDTSTNELHHHIIELVAHARDKPRCLSAIEDELTALKHAINDTSDVHSVNVSTSSAYDTNSASAQLLIKKYVEILATSCK